MGPGVCVQVIFLMRTASERLAAARPGAFEWEGIAVITQVLSQLIFPLVRLGAPGGGADKGTLVGVHCLVKE